ncbi:MAG: ribulose-phosphate 3-epimerase [Candidatus Diapherotrites archaeon]|nr:ribulose-phosphate 3-epimerase [Candidatus Diapherotrites archaeon]
MVKIAPSILSADFSRLGEQIKSVEEAGADYIHIDVMDGHFVPNITMGPIVVKAVDNVTDLPLDTHLMIDNPDTYIPEFIESGSDIISVHTEACKHLHRTLQLIRKLGAKPAVVLNPATPVYMIEHVLTDIDMVCLMTVNPGFGGQAFIKNVLPKITQLKEMREEQKLSFEIEIDGGINLQTAPQVVEKGADVLVAGSAIFKKPDPAEALKELRNAVL